MTPPIKPTDQLLGRYGL